MNALGSFLGSQWIVWLHVVSALGFVAVHGVSLGVAFKLKQERERERIKILLELSSTYRDTLYILLILVLGTGTLLGFTRAWWMNSKWIWLALGIFVAMFVAMIGYSKAFFQRLRVGLGMMEPENKNDSPEALLLTDEALHQLLATWNPWISVLIGMGGAALLAWLMMFKPF